MNHEGMLLDVKPLILHNVLEVHPCHPVYPFPPLSTHISQSISIHDREMLGLFAVWGYDE